MADKMTKAQRHYCMSRIHSSGTKPEIRLRRALWHLGFRYRVNYPRLPGKPDIVFGRYRTVVFVHGCFWHGHQGCSLYTVPKSNVEFWTAKLTRNRDRDRRQHEQLRQMGWRVIDVWECELRGDAREARLERLVGQIAEGV